MDTTGSLFLASNMEILCESLFVLTCFSVFSILFGLSWASTRSCCLSWSYLHNIVVP